MEIYKGEDKFYMGKEEPLAEIKFTVLNKEIYIEHTYVNGPLRGQGIAAQLVEKVLEYAKENNLKVVPICSYVKKYLEKEEVE